MAWNVWNVEWAQWESLTSFKTRAAAEGFLLQVVKPEKRGGGPFEVKRAGDVLENHGTKLAMLKPSAIWGAAMEDLKRRQFNSDPRRDDQFRLYAFHRKHVIKANSANDILRAAIAEPGLGLASGKKDTRLLYSDVELLKAALQ